MKETDDFSYAGDVLKNFFNRLLSEERDEYSNFFSGWGKIAGAETAMHVFPRDIVNNVLILETDHPLWSQQMRMRQEGLLKKIHGEYPSLQIKRLKIVIENGLGGKSTTEEKGEDNQVKEKGIKQKDKKGDEKTEFFSNLLDTMRRHGDS